MRFEPDPQAHSGLFIASLNKKSVEFTARKADGWLPVMIPVSGVCRMLDFANSAPSRKASVSDPKAVEVKAPGGVVITKNVERAKAGQAGTIAFYAARMGTFYSEQPSPARSFGVRGSAHHQAGVGYRRLVQAGT